ncbi:hypothetical protein DSECCO2_555800 [anaerobic digester metagenome]
MSGIRARTNSTIAITMIMTRRAMKQRIHPIVPMWVRRVRILKASRIFPVRANLTAANVERIPMMTAARMKMIRMARAAKMASSGLRSGSGPDPAGVTVAETGMKYIRKGRTVRTMSGIA